MRFRQSRSRNTPWAIKECHRHWFLLQSRTSAAANTAGTMDLKDSLVKGGVFIVHQIHDGKHHYEVDNVMKYRKASGEKALRKGDKLMHINSVDLQDVTPEELAQMLAEGSPMLTVHKPCRTKGPAEPPSPAEETLRPVSKDTVLLSFSMTMKREEELEKNGVGEEEEEGGEDAGIEEDICREHEDKDLLIVSMTKTSISVVSGRGCDHGSSCQGCHGGGCTFSDVVVVSETRKVTLVSRGSFKYQKTANAAIEHVATHRYLRGLCSQRTVYASPNPEKITIYSYKSSIVDTKEEGIPVVLNFTGSSCFLRCCMEGTKVVLQVETCEKQRLKRISTSDESALSFVFYMKSADRSKRLKFESALHVGWFIQIVNTDLVEMANMNGEIEDQPFLFIIQK